MRAARPPIPFNPKIWIPASVRMTSPLFIPYNQRDWLDANIALISRSLRCIRIASLRETS